MKATATKESGIRANRRNPTITQEWALVDPEFAELALRSNSTNRPIRIRREKALSAVMSAGDYQEIGQPIIFGKSGKLLDGQHRLRAVIRSGVSVWMLVVRGVEDDARMAIDDGVPHTFADELAINGLGRFESRSLATATRYAIAYANGSARLNQSCPNRVMEKFLSGNQGLITSTEFLARQPRRTAPVPHSLGAFLHFIFARIDREAADDFIHKLWTGENAGTAEDIRLQLRNELIARTLKKGMRNLDLLSVAIIRVWNSIRSGQPIAIKKAFRTDGPPVSAE